MPMAAERIIILGTGGNCVDILETISAINHARGGSQLVCAGFLDDDPERWGTSIDGVPVLGPLAAAGDHHDCLFVNGIGSPRNYREKQRIISTTGIAAERFATVVHPTASVSRTARIGVGTVLFQNVVVTNNAQLGSHVVVLPNVIVSHDSVIGDFSSVAGAVCIAGGVHVGHSCYLGSGCAIRDGVSIGDYSLVGMGSVVIADVARDSVVAGNPARLLRKTDGTPITCPP